VNGDVRFLSHQETMRLLERAAARAQLPLRFTQGFNPRPKLSLALPRPVGVGSCCELAVLELSGEVSDNSWAEALAQELPEGVKLLHVRPLPARKRPRVESVSYEMPVAPPEQACLQARLAELTSRSTWRVPRRRTGVKASKSAEMKGRIRGLSAEAGRLRFTIATVGGSTSGPGDVLALLGFADTGEADAADPVALGQALARLTRTDLQCEF